MKIEYYSILNHLYDDLSREIKTYRSDDPSCEPTTFAYDIWGRKTAETDAEGNTSRFSYNLLDHLLREERPHADGEQGPESLVKRYRRDRAGRMEALYLAEEATPVREIAYNGLGNPLSVISHPGAPYPDIGVSYAWDAAARMTSETDGAGKLWTYAYNSLGLLSRTTDPTGNSTTLAYDREGRMTDTSARDGAGNTVSFIHPTYTPMGETGRTSFSGGWEEYAYDAYGRLVSASTSGGVTLTYGDYDPASRPRTLACAVSGKTLTQSLAYKQNGALAQLGGLPSGNVSYSYDHKGRLSRVASPQGDFTYTYDPRGLPETLSLPAGGKISYSYYRDARPRSLSLEEAGQGEQASITLAYDSRGKIVAMQRDTGLADPATGTYAYSYDRLGRLAWARTPSSPPDYSYAYDPRGPLTSKTSQKEGESPQTVSFTLDEAGRLSSDSQGNTYTYDAAGRMIEAQGPRGLEQLSYDGLSRLSSALTSQGSVSYAYDHQGRMVLRSRGEEKEIFLPFAQTPETAAILSGEGESLLSFVCDPQGTRLLQKDKATSETSCPIRSPRADVIALSDASGRLSRTYAYSPCGETEEGYTQEGTPFLYQDDYLDPSTSLYHMQARWYDPQSSLFSSTDPQMGEAQDPSLRYPYAYCAGDPIGNSDPTGKAIGGRIIRGGNPGPDIRGGLFPQSSPDSGGGNGNDNRNKNRSKGKSAATGNPPVITANPFANLLVWKWFVAELMMGEELKEWGYKEDKDDEVVEPQRPRRSHGFWRGTSKIPIIGWFVRAGINVPARRLRYAQDNVAYALYHDDTGGRSYLALSMGFIRGIDINNANEERAFVGATQDDYRNAVLILPEFQRVFPGIALRGVVDLVPEYPFGKTISPTAKAAEKVIKSVLSSLGPDDW